MTGLGAPNATTWRFPAAHGIQPLQVWGVSGRVVHQCHVVVRIPLRGKDQLVAVSIGLVMHLDNNSKLWGIELFLVARSLHHGACGNPRGTAASSLHTTCLGGKTDAEQN